MSDMCEVSHNSGIRGLSYFYIQIKTNLKRKFEHHLMMHFEMKI